jgi:hypothetical protein
MNAKHSTRVYSPMPYQPRRDLRALETAARLERWCPGWVVIWSAWRQTFTAFSAVTAECVVIDDQSANRLLERVGAIQRAAAHGRAVIS